MLKSKNNDDRAPKKSISERKIENKEESPEVLKGKKKEKQNELDSMNN